MMARSRSDAVSVALEPKAAVIGIDWEATQESQLNRGFLDALKFRPYVSSAPRSTFIIRDDLVNVCDDVAFRLTVDVLHIYINNESAL